MKKILVTGGNGFIGRNLKESLGESYQVYAPARRELDLCDSEKTRRYLEEHRFDTVIHCANANSTRRRVTDYHVLYTNLRMYWNLSRCEDLYQKMYYFGSGAEYDMRHYIPDMSEEYFGAYIPQDPYGFSKYIMNQDARRSEKIFNLRLFGVYGKYEEWHRRFISNNMCRILRGLNISVNQDMEFDYLHIDDLCALMRRFIEYTPKYHDYNVCSGTPVRLSEIAELLHKHCGSGLPVRIKSKGEKLPYTADNTKLLDELGSWEFTDISSGIAQLWEYYCEAYRIDSEFREQVNRFAFD